MGTMSREKLALGIISIVVALFCYSIEFRTHGYSLSFDGTVLSVTHAWKFDLDSSVYHNHDFPLPQEKMHVLSTSFVFYYC